MTRRTPLLAFLLAPLAVVLAWWLWQRALVPLARNVRYSEPVLEWLLDSPRPGLHRQAMRDIARIGTEEPAVIDRIVEILASDGPLESRIAAAEALGHLGARGHLTDGAIQALKAILGSEQDVALVAAGLEAVGRSASYNRHSAAVSRRIVSILGEEQLPWVYPKAITALGRLGASQELPAEVVSAMTEAFSDPARPGEREEWARAFAVMAEGRRLPGAVREILLAALESESNPRVRVQLVYGLAHGAPDDPQSKAAVELAAADANQEVRRAAEHAARIAEHSRGFADREPIAIATDPDQPTERRRQALRILGSDTIDRGDFDAIARLADDADFQVRVAALELFHYLARSPGDDFDREILIPRLRRAMRDTDPEVRRAAFSALARIAVHRPRYPSAGDLSGRLDAGATDPDARVRVIALSMLIESSARSSQREAYLDQALEDPDPSVRRSAVDWLGSPRFVTSRRQKLIDRALADPDPGVRAVAAAARQQWVARDRTWPVELWQLWRSGERRQVGMRILIGVTVGAPIAVGVLFLFYFVARLLVLLHERRWRAVVVLPVVATWLAATYGMFLLYFLAGHVGDPDGRETAILASLLWGAIALYGLLGWGLHFLVRARGRSDSHSPAQPTA